MATAVPRAEGSARARMVSATATLIRRQGVAATGMREIVSEAQAPRGSLQHYFPGGKQQLVVEALQSASTLVVALVDGYLDRHPDAAPSELFAAMTGWWRRLYDGHGFAEGCPFAATAADAAATDPHLRSAAAQALAAWQLSLEIGISRTGVPAPKATRLAQVMMSALEGALILARAQQSTEPLRIVSEELAPLLDAGVPRRRRRK